MSLLIVPIRPAPSELPKCCYLSCSTPCPSGELRTRSYQRVTIYRAPPTYPGGDSRPRSHRSVAMCCVSPEVLRPRSDHVSLFTVFPTRLAPSELPKNRYLSFFPPDWRLRSCKSTAICRVPRPTGALGVTKMLLFMVFPTRRLVSSELPKCR